MWDIKQKEKAISIIAAKTTLSHMRLKNNRVLAWIIGVLLGISIAAYQLGVASKAQKDMGSMYVMVDQDGIPIEGVPLQQAYPSEEEAYEFVSECMTKMFDVDALSYREQTLRFLEQCMTISDGVDFVYAFKNSGFYELVQSGAVLQMDVTRVSLDRHFINNDTLNMRFDIEGIVYIMRGGARTTDLELSVIVRRQNLHQYESGLRITQVIW